MQFECGASSIDDGEQSRAQSAHQSVTRGTRQPTYDQYDDINLPDPLQQYVIEHSLREAPVLARLRQVTAALPQAGLQIAPEQGQFMQLLVRLLGAKRCLEIGTFTGYLALAVALALPGDGGERVTCDVSVEWTQIARQFWREAGVDARIDLRLAPALATLDALLSSGSGSSFDFAFIDADKGNYVAYYERVVELLRPGGLRSIMLSGAAPSQIPT